MFTIRDPTATIGHMKKGYFLLIISYFLSATLCSAGTVPPEKNTVQVPILVYHSFGPKVSKKENKTQRHYRIDEANFEAQMKYLKDAGYTPITFKALVAYYLSGTTIPDKAIVLTFDDGWYTQYKYAVPILEKYKFTATFFIISNYLQKPYMSATDIQTLNKAGFEIASHSAHHPMLTKLTGTKAHDEIFNSKKKLEEVIGHTIATFAYPDYATNKDIQKIVAAAGYSAGRAGWIHGKNGKGNIFALKSQEAVNNPNPFSSKVVE